MNSIEQKRQEIDKINAEIINLLRKRFEILDEIKTIKENQKLPLYDPNRESEMFEKVKGKLNNSKATPFILDIFNNVISSSLNYLKNKD